jgi:hypothetical protein
MSRHEWIVKIDGGDVAGITLVGARITYGRRTVDEQPAPGSASITLLTADISEEIADKFPDFGPGDFAARSGFVEEWENKYVGANSRLTIGAAVTLDANVPGGFVQEWDADYTGGSSLRRFTGRITSLDYAFGTVRITAVDNLEKVARIAVDTTRPAETDVERAKHYAALAGITLTVDGNATVALLPVEKGSPSNALTQLYGTAREAGAIVYADRSGVVHYRARNAEVAPIVALPGEFTILDSLSMKAELGEVINRVTVSYGIQDPVTKIRPSVTVESQDSITRYGVFSENKDTKLAKIEDAQELATRVIGNEAFPLYAMPEAQLTLVKDDPATIDLLADIDLDGRVTVSPLPIGAPALSYTARLLGYVEEAASPDWLISYQLAPSEYLEERLLA